MVISETIAGQYLNFMEPKRYTWEKLNDGSKATVRLEFIDKKAYCSIMVENTSPQVQRRLFQARLGDALYRVQFSSPTGGGLIEVDFYANEFKRSLAADGTLAIEQTIPVACSGAMFKSINSANIWQY